VTLDGEPLAGDALFTPERPGSSFDHLLAQAAQVVTGNREGGFFIMIGRKPGPGAST
jgi:hypothetical protein